jgi:hypothetical protein
MKPVAPSYESRYSGASACQRFDLPFERFELESAPTEIVIIALDPAVGE